MMMSHIISDVIDTSFQMGIHQQKWWLFSMTRIGRSLEWDLMKVNHSLCSTPHLGYEGQITRRNETCCKCCSNTAMKNAVWISKGFEYGQWMKRNWPTYNTPRRRLSHDISSFFLRQGWTKVPLFSLGMDIERQTLGRYDELSLPHEMVLPPSLPTNINQCCCHHTRWCFQDT